MSSYIYIKIFNVNHEKKSVNYFLPDVCMNSLKHLSECRGVLEVDPSEHISKKEREKIKNYTSYTDNVYVASIFKSDLEKLKKLNIRYTLKTDLENEVIFLKSENDIEKVKSFNVDTSVIFSAIENKDKVYAVYLEESKQLDGLLYDEQSFINILMKYEKKLKELTERQIKCKQILMSIDYMKLTSDEKENVDNEIAVLDEDVAEINAKITTCHKVLGLFEVACEYDCETFIFAYEC